MTRIFHQHQVRDTACLFQPGEIKVGKNIRIDNHEAFAQQRQRLHYPTRGFERLGFFAVFDRQSQFGAIAEQRPNLITQPADIDDNFAETGKTAPRRTDETRIGCRPSSSTPVYRLG